MFTYLQVNATLIREKKSLSSTLVMLDNIQRKLSQYDDIVIHGSFLCRKGENVIICKITVFNFQVAT
jgi:hypothetical protein